MNVETGAQDFLNSLAGSITHGLSALLQGLFGSSVNHRIAGPLSWVDFGVVAGIFLLVLGLNAFTALFVRRKKNEPTAPELLGWKRQIVVALATPFHLLMWVYGCNLAAITLLEKYPASPDVETARGVIGVLFDLGLFVVFFWLFFRLTRVLDSLLETWAKRSQSKVDEVLAPLLGRSLRIIVPVVGVIFALPLLELPAKYTDVVGKGSSILIILTAAWVFFQAVRVLEKTVTARFDISAPDNLQARKVYTQVHVISKTAYVLISIFTVASILMLFEEARRFGTSILASAGVLGVVLGIAAQQTFANLFAGFQIALAQPIRLDDVVVVEGEWGRVQEITLTYVIVHIWDDRRMVLPLSYFIQKPFQNWTRDSAFIMGSVLVWADYTLPVAEVREAVGKIVEGCALWDRRFWNLQVSDASEHTMQIRVLCTAANSSQAWDLRCEVREKLIDYIQKHHPECLPRTRTDSTLHRFAQAEDNRIKELPPEPPVRTDTK